MVIQCTLYHTFAERQAQISGGSYESLAFLDDNPIAPVTKHPKPSDRTLRREAVFAAFAAQAKRVAEEAALAHATAAPAIMCTGGFRSQHSIEKALSQGIDLIGIGRAAAVDLDFPGRLLRSTSSHEQGQDLMSSSSSSVTNQEVHCLAYSIRGGEWLSTLVPLKLVGGGLSTLWHQAQIQRISRNRLPSVNVRFETLLLSQVVPVLISYVLPIVLLPAFAISVYRWVR